MSFTEVPQHPSGLVDVDTICAYIGALVRRDGSPLNYRTLMRWIEFGGLPSHKVGRCRLFDQAEVAAWMRSPGAEQLAS